MALDSGLDKWFRDNPDVAGKALWANPYYKKEDSPENKYQNLVAETSKSALNYEKNLPSLQDQNQNMLQDQSRMDLARAYTGADRQANQRGMFYGGKRAGLRGQAESGVANNLAQGIRSDNQGLIDTSQRMGDVGLESGMASRNTQQQLNNQAYDEALSNRSRGTFLSNLGASAPKLIGGLLGKAKGGFGTGDSTSMAGGAGDAGGTGSMGSGMMA